MSSLSEMKVVRTKRLPKQVSAPRSRTPLYYSRSQNTVWLGIDGMFHEHLREEFKIRPADDPTLISGAVELDELGREEIYWDYISDGDEISMMRVRFYILEKVFGVKPLISPIPPGEEQAFVRAVRQLLDTPSKKPEPESQ